MNLWALSLNGNDLSGAIQGAMSADGLGNLLSGLAGTLPNTTYATGISIRWRC